MNDLVDHPRAERALRRELPRREDHVERSRQADEPRKPLRSAGSRDEAEARLGQTDADVRCIRRDPRVASQRDLQATAERRPVDRRDRDAGESGEVVEHPLHRAARLLDVALRRPAQQREIRAGDELAFLAARDDQAARRRVARRGYRGGQVFHEPHVDRIHRIAGTIDHDPRDAGGVGRNERD